MSRLTISNLVKTFGSVTAVDDVSFEVDSGEFLALLGPSGSGKTTILRLIGGFEEATGGQIIIDGRDIRSMPPHKRNIGVVFQKYALFPHMTVVENVAYPLRRRGLMKSEIVKLVQGALDIVGLQGFDDRQPKQLSGGQQQRVALARAMVFKPDMLLMDEPLGALDKQLRERMQFEIRSLQKRVGITAIYVTHDQTEAIAMADKIGVVNRGQIEQIGFVQEVYYRPQTRFVAEFVGNSNLFPVTRTTRRDGGITVHLLDDIAFECNPSSATGALLFMVRPERVCLTLVPPVQARTNTILGTVSALTFLGDRTHFRVQTRLGPFDVSCQHDGSIIGIKVGQPVHLAWSIADCTVVAA